MGDPFWLIFGTPIAWCLLKFIDGIPAAIQDWKYLYKKHVRKEVM